MIRRKWAEFQPKPLDKDKFSKQTINVQVFLLFKNVKVVVCKRLWLKQLVDFQNSCLPL